MRDHQEEARLDALYQLNLLDTSAAESFDRITRMASQIFDLPIAAVSLTDRDRQWFKSRVGVDHHTIPRSRAPCSQVAETTRVLVLEDLADHPCYSDSPLAHSGIRFYAGAPLITNDGYGLGALCVLGTEPRRVTPGEAAALVDLAAMVMAQIELQHAFGRIDPVSGLATRNQFRDDLADLAREHPGERRFAVVVDLAREDQIGRIARALGGARIDEMIREASRALRAVLGRDRPAYIVGAAQFAFLSPPGVDQDAYMRELQEGFASIRRSSSVRFVTNVAIGVRPFVLGDATADDVLRGAASAAQDARSMDAVVATYSSSSDAAHRRKYRLLADFGAALDQGDQLRLVYQPRIDLDTGRCVAAEALLRWRHPSLGEISPAEFIPIIEQTSLARATTQWVLETAMDQIAGWERAGLSIMVAVNISAFNLAEPDLIGRIQLELMKRRLRADRLEIEVTESAFMERPEQAITMLAELADAGVRIAIDDFGTGHSSLAYLQKLPASIVKTDQTFVRDLEHDHGSDFILLEAMIRLAQKLGFRVVAEGVETEAAAGILRTIGCEEAQGFLFARPMEAEDLGGWAYNRWPLEGSFRSAS